MRPWYEPRKNRPDIPKDAKKKKGIVGFLDILWREFFSLVGLNLLFVVTCIPVVTIPASITAMSRITVTMAKDKTHFLFVDYFKAFRRDFWRSLAAGAIFLVLMIAFGFSTYFYFMQGRDNGSGDPIMLFMILAAISACLFVITVMTASIFFPMLAMVDLNVTALLRNSLVLVGTSLKRTIPMLLYILLFEVFLGIGLLPQSVIYIGLIMFSLTNLMTSYLVVPMIEERVLDRSSLQEEDEAEEPDDDVIGDFPELESAAIGEFPDLDEDAKKEEP